MRGPLFCLLAVAMLVGATRAEAECRGTGCYCSVTATTVAFGTYDPVSRLIVDTNGNIEVTCGALDAGTRISYEISLSTGISGNYASRTMTSGPHPLTYNLYTKANRKAVWGDGSGRTDVITDQYKLKIPCCETRTYVVYGRIDGGQYAAPGHYADAIVVTVAW